MYSSTAIDSRLALSDKLTQCLLDLRRKIEEDLRTLTSTQCLIERIRSGEADPQAMLLIGEMARLMNSGASPTPAGATQWAEAVDMIERLRAEYAAARSRADLKQDALDSARAVAGPHFPTPIPLAHIVPAAPSARPVT